jgi:hypothetical protein
MADYTISLDSEQVEALEAMLDTEDLGTRLQSYVENMASNYIRERVREEEEAKPIADRKSAISGFKIKKDS